jgi:hypothetical protein
MAAKAQDAYSHDCYASMGHGNSSLKSENRPRAGTVISSMGRAIGAKTAIEDAHSKLNSVSSLIER